MGIDQKIIERVQKLLNLKEGAEAVGSYAEAENAASRLQDLLMRYNLDLDTVRASTIEKKAEMSDEWIHCGDKQDKRESNWIPDLYYAIASNNLCKVWIYDKSVRIIGHKHNVALVSYITEQMIAKIRIAERQAFKIYETQGGFEKRGTYRRGFFKGASIGIGVRLKKDKEVMTQDNNPFAVMIVSRESEVMEYIYEKWPHLRPENRAEQQRKAQEKWDALPEKEKERIVKEAEREAKRQSRLKGPRQIGSTDGYYQGYEAGKKMQINSGVESSPNTTKGNISN
jgi:rRNA processing protein Krr1/Pno1